MSGPQAYITQSCPNLTVGPYLGPNICLENLVRIQVLQSQDPALLPSIFPGFFIPSFFPKILPRTQPAASSPLTLTIYSFGFLVVPAHSTPPTPYQSPTLLGFSLLPFEVFFKTTSPTTIHAHPHKLWAHWLDFPHCLQQGLPAHPEWVGLVFLSWPLLVCPFLLFPEF